MLFSASKTTLLLIDLQTTFLDKLPPAAAATMAEGSAWLVDVATWLEIPVFATVEEGRYPKLAPCLTERIDTARTFCKTTYNAAALEPLADALRGTARRSIILAGLETDVCVAQTALGLTAAGYRTAFIDELTASPGNGHARGAARMQAAGVTTLSLRGVFFEWMADARIERLFRSERPALAARMPFAL